MSNTAPGPDCITYSEMRKENPSGTLLATLFNAFMRLQGIPLEWKHTNTVLIYKKGSMDSIANWRPLAMGDTIPKFYAAILADRITEWVLSNHKLSASQKGFLPYEGCHEHNYLLQEVINDAKKRRRSLAVAWLDLTNAFGSVPHSSIFPALTSSGIPDIIINIIKDLYANCTTRIRAKEGYTSPINMGAGVRQGCPLSPIIFYLALEHVIRTTEHRGDGYTLVDNDISTLAYADDQVIVASTEDSLTNMLVTAESAAADLGLAFNPDKCATLTLSENGRVEGRHYTIHGHTIQALALGEHYEHLGIPTGVGVHQSPYASLKDMEVDLHQINASLLKPWQKVDALTTFVLTRLDFLLRGALVEKGLLKDLD